MKRYVLLTLLLLASTTNSLTVNHHLRAKETHGFSGHHLDESSSSLSESSSSSNDANHLQAGTQVYDPNAHSANNVYGRGASAYTNYQPYQYGQSPQIVAAPAGTTVYQTPKLSNAQQSSQQPTVGVPGTSFEETYNSDTVGGIG